MITPVRIQNLNCCRIKAKSWDYERSKKGVTGPYILPIGWGIAITDAMHEY